MAPVAQPCSDIVPYNVGRLTATPSSSLGMARVILKTYLGAILLWSGSHMQALCAFKYEFLEKKQLGIYHDVVINDEVRNTE